MRLTPAEARALPPGKILFDHEVIGLRLKANAASKSWLLRYVTRAGDERTKKLGRFPEMSLSSARETAKQLKQRVALGEDPSADWKASRDIPTVCTLCDRYVNEWAPGRVAAGELAEKTLAQQIQLIESQIKPGLGRKKIDEVTPAMVDRFLDDVLNRRISGTQFGPKTKTAYTTARHARGTLSRIFALATTYFGYKLDKNPVHGTTSYKRILRRRHATEEELPRIHAALEKLKLTKPYSAACIWTLFLTGARVAEVCEARKDQRQVRRSPQGGLRHVLLLEQHKTVKQIGAKEVELPKQAVEILEGLPVAGDRVFGDLPMWKLEEHWIVVRNEAGCPDLKLLDARRTFASHAASLGMSLFQVGEMLFHSDVASTQSYAFLLETKRATNVTEVANRISRVANPTSSVPPLPFREAPVGETRDPPAAGLRSRAWPPSP